MENIRFVTSISPGGRTLSYNHKMVYMHSCKYETIVILCNWMDGVNSEKNA